ncbi:ribonuclease H-like domain-containing protein [Tanacetum coccineum]
MEDGEGRREDENKQDVRTERGSQRVHNDYGRVIIVTQGIAIGKRSSYKVDRLPHLEELATTAKSTMMAYQVLVLMEREVDKDLKFVEKFRELCLEVANTMKVKAEVIDDLERFTHLHDNLEVVEIVRMLRRVQPRDMEKVDMSPAAQTTTNADGSSTTLIPGPVTADEKNQKKNDVKARNCKSTDILDENISQEDLNLTFLRKSMPSEVENSIISTNEVNTAYEVNTANIQVSPASSQVSTASTQVSTANLSDATIYAFLANQPNGSQLVHEDLEQIHEDDLEEMDLKWQLALLSMRTKRLGHFARECRGPRNQDSRNWNQDSSRRIVNVEETSSKAMLAIDGAGFDWSYMADDEVPTNMALMAFLDSEVHNDKTCSKTCLKSFETLKTQLDDLRIEFNKSEFNLATYKRGLASVEEQLVFYKKNEVIFCEQLAVLKRDISYKDSEISMLKRLFSPPKLDLSNSGLEEFQQPEFEGDGPKTSKNVSEDTSNEVRESPDASLVEELVSKDKLEKKTAFPTSKIDFGHTQKEDQGYVDSGCSRHMTGNMSYLSNFKEFDGGYVTFRGGAKGGKITGKRTLKTADESRVLLKVSRKNNIYNVDMKNIVPKECLTCLVAKATLDESMLWHRRLGSSYLKGKHTKPLVKSKIQTSITKPKFQLHMELSFTWVFFLTTKDETGGILKSFITEIENLVDKKVKIIRCDNGTEFKNRVMSEFYVQKGIKKEFSIARTPQQNGVAEMRNRTLIEAARTMVLVVKPHNKTPYELFRGDGPKWLFDIDVLTSINYLLVVVGINSNDLVGMEESIGAGHSSNEIGSSQDYILMPMWKDGLLFDSSLKNASND